MVESDGKIYKVIDAREVAVYKKVRSTLLLRGGTVTHFILPVITDPTENNVSYEKVPYGPLEVIQASKYLRTVLEKIYTAVVELHSFGYAYGDVWLPNVCFNSNYDAVLIDTER